MVWIIARLSPGMFMYTLIYNCQPIEREESISFPFIFQLKIAPFLRFSPVILSVNLTKTMPLPIPNGLFIQAVLFFYLNRIRNGNWKKYQVLLIPRLTNQWGYWEKRLLLKLIPMVSRFFRTSVFFGKTSHYSQISVCESNDTERLSNSSNKKPFLFPSPTLS